MIETKQLTKRYGQFTAVNALSFTAEAGQVLGLLGPNGAGKSTTMRMIAGFLAPTSGRAAIAGFDVQTHPIQAKSVLGYLPEGAPSYGEMTVRQFLEFIGQVRGLQGDFYKKRFGEVVERLHLAPVLDQPIDTLSKGFKRRVGLAQAILHDPKVLILDEPTDGLDPNQKHEVRELIHDMAPHKTIIISTHILEEVQALCRRALIIARGKIVADDTPSGLESRSRYHGAVSLRLAPQHDLKSAKDELCKLKMVNEVEMDETTSRLTAFPRGSEGLLNEINLYVQEKNWSIIDLQVEAGRLDEVFRTITAAEAV